MTNKPPVPGNGLLERYLLGDVSDHERAELEQEYFANDELFERLVEAQNDLVDSYVQGTLIPAERKRFEDRFLTTDSGAERVEFARALWRKTASRAPQSATPWLQQGLRKLSIAASIALVGLAGAWLIYSSQQRNEPIRTQSPPSLPQMNRQAPAPPLQAQEQPRPVDRALPPQQPAPRVRESSLVTVLLTPGVTRDSDAATPLVLRPAPQWVRLELVLEEDRFDSYAAELQDVEGRVLWKAESLQAVAAPSGRMVTMRVPAKLIPPSDYVVILQGIRKGKSTEISNYTFTVVPVRR